MFNPDKIITTITIILVFSISAMAATINVPTDQPTIQDGIDAASDYDTVLVAPGIYDGLINFDGKLIVVKSETGPLATIITGPATMYSALVTFENDETEEAVLEGFTLLGGWLGVYCAGSGPTIRYNILKNQQTTDWAAVAIAYPGYPPEAIGGAAPARIINNTIINCANGGVSCFSMETAVVRNNIIAFNENYGLHLASFMTLDNSYNDVYGNGVDYINAEPGEGSISANPMFNTDYSLSPGSPCIDAGDPDPIYNDPDGSRSDMGGVKSGMLYPIALNVNFGEGVDNNQIYDMTPEIFWSYFDPEETVQQAFEIEVGTDEDWSAAEMWASGTIYSSDTSYTYNGDPLVARMAYYLRIRLNDGDSWGMWSNTHFSVYNGPVVIDVPADYDNIQDAIDNSIDDDTILVAPGTYEGLINFNGKLVMLQSTDGPLETIITGSADMYSALVTFNHGETEAAILDGFTLQGGWLGVYCEGAGPTITHNILENQQTNDWAAISLAGPGYPPHAGMGPAPARIINNTIVKSTNGGISSFSTEAPVIKNNIISFNEGYGIYLYDWYNDTLPSEISYNDVYGNETDYINCLPGEGAISQDPLFELAFEDNFALLPNSPCVDAGDPDPTYNDPDDTRNDMGAVPAIREYPLAIDINFGPGVDNDAVNSLSPVFYWSYFDSEVSSQQGYQIQVGTDQEWTIAELWSTGPIYSVDTSVVYSGNPLEERKLYIARIRVTDGTGWGSYSYVYFKIVASGFTINVPGDFEDIQDAVNHSYSGDTILVGPGEYTGPIDFGGRAIALMSSDGPQSTTILGTGYDLVTMGSGDTGDAVLEGFTLSGGNYGVYCEGIGSVIRRNIFTGQSESKAAVIAAGEESISDTVRIVNNTIVNGAGHGIKIIENITAIIKNNIIAFNDQCGVVVQNETMVAEFTYNDVYGNQYNFMNIYPSVGCLEEDPLLGSSFSLLPESPCIDAGDPDPVYNDPDGSRNDMGALWIDEFMAGDANEDDTINLMDVVYVINYLYKDGPEPTPVPQSGDANGDSALNILDVAALVNYLYHDGPPPTMP